jgi:hypothetical protein
VSERAALVEEWLEQGGNVLADDLVVLGERGVVMPTAVGFAERPTYQWIDGLTPSWGRADAPVVDEEGYLVDYRVLEEAAYASAPLPALIVAIGGAEGGPVGVPTGDALRALLQTRVAGRRAVSEREAGDTVAWLAAASSVRVNLTEPARAARSLRELLTALTADK